MGRFTADPKRAPAIRKIRDEMQVEDRAHAMSLAMVRKAAELTQHDLAANLGLRQGNISSIENRDDILLSTLRNYITALGAAVM